MGKITLSVPVNFHVLRGEILAFRNFAHISHDPDENTLFIHPLSTNDRTTILGIVAAHDATQLSAGELLQQGRVIAATATNTADFKAVSDDLAATRADLSTLRGTAADRRAATVGAGMPGLESSVRDAIDVTDALIVKVDKLAANQLLLTQALADFMVAQGYTPTVE